MPTYEYACKDCGEHLEIVQSFRDDALTECPRCDGRLRKVFSAAGIIFKGSGWHVKDYASSSNRPSGHESETSGDGDGGADGTSDRKDDGAAPSTTGGSEVSGGSGDKGSGDKGTGGKGSSSDAGSTSSGGKDRSASSSGSVPRSSDRPAEKKSA